MSELEELRKFKENSREKIKDLNHEIDNLNNQVYNLEQCNEDQIEIKSLNDQMKLDFIKKNWDKLTLENLEAIVSNPMTI